MHGISKGSFGLIIAFLIPGFVLLWGCSYFSDVIRIWLTGHEPKSPAIGGFLYVILASLAGGLLVSAVRWAIIDHIHHWTGIPARHLDFSQLKGSLEEFEAVVESHYRFYQYYANTLVALFPCYILRTIHLGRFDLLEFAIFLVVAAALFWGSRDALSKYYERTAALLGAKG